jgi:hypothetical protein
MQDFSDVFRGRIISSIIWPALHNLYSSPSIIRVIKSGRMRWAGHAARMGERRNAYRKARRKETTGKTKT